MANYDELFVLKFITDRLEPYELLDRIATLQQY